MLSNNFDYLPRCEYCNIDLGDTIYWSHLQIHMSGNIDPTSTSPGEKAMMGM